MNWQQWNGKQKWTIGICAIVAALFFGYVGYWRLYAIRILFNIFETSSCVAYDFDAVNPLLIDRETSVRIGKGSGSDCSTEGYEDNTWTWMSQNSEVATVSVDGILTGMTPGKFGIIAQKGTEKLYLAGTVYPPDWRVRTQPEAATVRVGDRVTIQMVATDSKGKPLPPVFFSLHTPDYQQPGPHLSSDPLPNPTPLLDRSFHGMGTQPGTFRALRPGTVIITGTMAKRTKQMIITVKE
ncbi:Ig-like domain-containing protein [Phormidesmis priestleyi]